MDELCQLDGPGDRALEKLPNGTVVLRHDDVVVRTRHVRRWAAVLADVTLDVTFGPSWTGPNLFEALERLYNLFNALIDALGDRHIGGRDELQFTIMSPGLDVPIFVPLRRWTELTAGYILDHIERVLQSKAQIPLDAGFTVHVGVFRRIELGYNDPIRFAGTFAERERDVRRKRGVVYIDNSDNACLPRAIAVSAFHRMKRDSDPLPRRPSVKDVPAARRYIATCFESGYCSEAMYDRVKRGDCPWQGYAADYLMEAAGLAPGTAGLFEHIPLYEAVLGVKIHVLGAVGGPMSFLTSRDKVTQGSAHLYLLFNWREGGAEHDGHVHSLVWIRDVFESAGICPHCREDVRAHTTHRCKAKCSKCKAAAVPTPEIASRGGSGTEPCIGRLAPGESVVTCADCNGTFYSQACFRNHTKNPKRANKRQGDDNDSDDDGYDDKSLCQKYWHCPLECGKSYQRYQIDPANHVCYEYWCHKCYTLEQRPGEHQCYVRAIPADTPSRRPTRFGVYDFESTVSNADTCGDYTPTVDPTCASCDPARKCAEHERCVSCRSPWCGRRNASVHSVNCACFMTFCDRCYDPKDLEATLKLKYCEHCGSRCLACLGANRAVACRGNSECGLKRHNFVGPDALARFSEHVVSAKHKGMRLYAHNGSRYDSFLLLDELRTRRGITPSIVYNNGKLMQFRVPEFNMSVSDSMLFIPIALGKFDATFGLGGRALKGFFPHLFNTNDKFGYRGPVPDTAFFSPDTMSSSTRHEFLAWHAERSAAGDYDFDSEILKYCENDVTILALGVMQFRAMVMEVAGFCPFTKCMTLSSTAMRIFKKRFLAEYFSAEDEAGNPVVLTQRDGRLFSPEGRQVARSDFSKVTFVSSDLAYQPKTSMAGPNHSKASLQWLAYQESLHPDASIRSAASPKGEYRAGRYYFDGVDEGRKIVYEFHVSVFSF